MISFNLTVLFDAQDLNVILQANELVTIVYGVSAVVTSATPGLHSSARSEPPATAWLAFSPIEKNLITWGDNYELYVSRTTEKDGGTIQTFAKTAAVPTAVVPFLADGVFGKLVDGVLSPGHYGVLNQYNAFNYMTFGLCAATNPVINGQQVGDDINIMSASIVPLHQNVQLAPTNSLQVFLQTGTADGMTLPNSIVDVAPIAFSLGHPNVTIRYNSQTGSFERVN